MTFLKQGIPRLSYGVQTWVNLLALVGMSVWFVCSILFTFVPYPNRFLVYQFPIGCAPVVCRNGSLSAGHTIVWIVIMGFGLIAGYYVRRPLPSWWTSVTDGMIALDNGGRWRRKFRGDVFFDTHFWFAGALLAFFFGCYHEFLWNAIATFVYGVSFLDFLLSANGITGYITFDAIAVVLIMRSRAGDYVDKRKLVFMSLFWVLFMVLWASIGFPVTFFNGHTVWYSNLDVNFIEINSFLIMFTGAVGSLKGGSFS